MNKLTSDRLRFALQEAKYLEHRDERSYWFALLRLDLIRENWIGDDVDLGNEVDTFLRKDPIMFKAVVQERNFG